MYKQMLEKLIKHKNETGQSWSEISRKIGISYSLVTKLACGDKDNPTARTMEAINDYLKSVESTEAA